MDSSLAGYHFFFGTFAFVLGAVVGSFLNVCIYRMPLDLSVNEPRRSFCPACKKQLKWHQNIPLLSWLFLRGRCANCGSRIAFRYFAVELLTALLFLAVWRQFPWQIAIAYWIFVSLLIVATFVDFEHFIIPDQITFGGTAAGIVASFILPALMGTDRRIVSVITSLASAVLGYGLLWFVLQGGKIAFGKKSLTLTTACDFSWIRRSLQTDGVEESDADLVVGDVSWKSEPPLSLWRSLSAVFVRLFAWLRGIKETQRGESWIWSETFGRETDVLTMKCPHALVDSEEFRDVTLSFTHDKLRIDDRIWDLDHVNHITGSVLSLIIPREAMGRGDLKFLAAIGAFLGWRAVLFSVFAGSLLGSLVGLGTLLIGRRVWSAKLPFGPYLAFGGLFWMFFGESLLSWYLGLLNP
jgi:leader peptidase (prepilin peptidase) / N-methyltransferase